MDLGLANKRAIVTGGSRGIGLAISDSLIKDGASIATCARGQDALDKGEPVTGVALAEGLIAYSERREEYVKEIQNMIRYNKLERFNDTEN